MNFLSKQLEKYYNTKNRKFLFKNGLTLNNLALLMWEDLGFREVDPSVISRIIHGERLFTHRQLESFCRILRLTKEQVMELRQALMQDILARNAINTDILQASDILNSRKHRARSFINILRVLRKDGHPQEVIIFSDLLENIINSHSFPHNKDKQTLALIYNEKSRAFGETASSGEVLDFMNALNQKAVEIGEEIKDRGILDMAYMNMGGAYYVAKKWIDSSTFLESKLKKVSNETKIEFLRTMLLDYAYQQDYQSFKKYLRVAIKLVDKQNNNKPIIASLYEAIARSFAIFGLTKEARKILEAAGALYLDPFYESQVIRGYIFTFLSDKKLNRNIDHDRLDQIIERSRDKKFLPYKRHRNQIEKMIKRLK